LATVPVAVLLFKVTVRRNRKRKRKASRQDTAIPIPRHKMVCAFVAFGPWAVAIHPQALSPVFPSMTAQTLGVVADVSVLLAAFIVWAILQWYG
jgi:hypothetical protein